MECATYIISGERKTLC